MGIRPLGKMEDDPDLWITLPKGFYPANLVGKGKAKAWGQGKSPLYLCNGPGDELWVVPPAEGEGGEKVRRGLLLRKRDGGVNLPIGGVRRREDKRVSPKQTSENGNQIFPPQGGGGIGNVEAIEEEQGLLLPAKDVVKPLSKDT